MKRLESMARRIWECLTLIGLICVLLTALGTAFLFHRAFGRQLDRDLARTAEPVAAAYENHGITVLEDYFPMRDSLRLTLIEPDGDVLYESSGATDIENHLDRPEVQAALESGSGAATRRSATVGYETHYYALRLSDGNILRLADEADDLWSSYTQALPWLLGGVLVVLALGALLAWWLTRRLVRPITRMAEHLDDIEAYVPYTELEPLAHTVQQDRKLREDNEAMRREFTANVSHELKTPLTSISGFAEMIESGMVKPADVPTFAKRIHREAKRMIALVADILQLSELDSMGDKNAAERDRARTGGPGRTSAGHCRQHDGPTPARPTSRWNATPRPPWCRAAATCWPSWPPTCATMPSATTAPAAKWCSAAAPPPTAAPG